MNEDQIDLIGTMLEDKGLSHSEIDDFFEHSGVKGMKWGVRKAAKKDVRDLAGSAREIIRESRRAQTPEARQAAAARYKAEVLDKVLTPEWKKSYQEATRMTKGQMALHVVAYGPFAALTIPMVKNANKKEAGYNFEVDVAHDILREMQQP